MGNRSDAYSGLQVSAERIAALRDYELSELFRQLLRAHAHKVGVSADAAYVNSEDKAKDDGCDAWSGPAARPDAWLGAEETCWQLKAGVAGEPSKLRGEVKKLIPRTTLSNGGRLVVVASGSTNGKKGQDDRLAVVLGEAKVLGLPLDKVFVFGAERLAEWFNEHPALAWSVSGNPAKFVQLSRWETSQQHQVQWQPAADAQMAIDAIRRDLDFDSGQVKHIHIEGPPGVGKTRFALELSRGAPWSADVVYVRQAAEVDVGGIIQAVTNAEGARLVVVADEVQKNQLVYLNELVGYAEGRVRLVTIGHSSTPDPDAIRSFRISPLEDAQMRRLVQAWHAGMPREYVDFVVRFADGYVRLAQLAANAVAKNPAGSVKDLLDQRHIRDFLDGMLGAGDRRALYVVAALSTVGWDEDVAQEGAAIAAHFGLDWNAVQAEVEQFDRAFGIAPRGGRRRYISPTPLAAHLAAEAWAAMPGAMRSLPDVLPSDSAKEAYFDRIRTIATTPFARDFAIEDLRTFFDMAAFRTESDIKRWAALSAAAPLLAATGVLKALSKSTLEERRAIAGASRRHLLSGLVSLASGKETFREAAISLALLAEAENETYANNSTGEFETLYQIRLGGTAAPYSERVVVAREILSFGREALARIVMKALSKAAETRESRIQSPAEFGRPEEIEWRPGTHIEYVNCVVLAIETLQRLHETYPSLEPDLGGAISAFAGLLWIDELRPKILSFLRQFAESSSLARKVVVAAMSRYVQGEEKYWNRLAPSAMSEVTSQLTALMPADVLFRLEHEVGTGSWDKDENFSFQGLAGELIRHPELLGQALRWLTSGAAADAWRFGQAVADLTDLPDLVELLMSMEQEFGPDLRFVLAVVDKARGRLGEGWFKSWIANLDLSSARNVDLLIESIWRIGAVEGALSVTADHLNSVSRGALLGLAYGTWYQTVERELLSAFLEKVANCDAEQVVLSVVDQATKSSGTENGLERLIDRLLSSVDLLRSGGTMVEYHWKELALRFLESRVGLILKAILRAHTMRSGGGWFVKHSQISEVIESIAKRYPEEFWAQIHGYLESPELRSFLCIGFPGGLFASVPFRLIRDWIQQDVDERAALFVHVVGLDFFDDSSHSMLLMNEFGGQPGVDGAFFSAFVSGSWTGPASTHWYELADLLQQLSRIRDGYFKTWAKAASQSLIEMGDRDRRREEEEQAIWKNR